MGAGHSRAGVCGGLGSVQARRLIAVCTAMIALAGPARADTLVADLSEHLVAITTGFHGAEVLLFGAIEGPGDVIVIVRGPERRLVMHRKSRVLGVWVNTASMTFEQAPSFFAMASSRPPEEIAAATVRAREEMGLEYLRLNLPPAKASPNLAAEWRAGLIRNHQARGLYATEVTPVTFLGSRLFRTEIVLPANVPTGAYKVQVYLLQDGQVVSAQTTPLSVKKTGAEAAIFRFAYERPALYGAAAILLALVAGLMAHMAFRKV